MAPVKEQTTYLHHPGHARSTLLPQAWSLKSHRDIQDWFQTVPPWLSAFCFPSLEPSRTAQPPRSSRKGHSDLLVFSLYVAVNKDWSEGLLEKERGNQGPHRGHMSHRKQGPIWWWIGGIPPTSPRVKT